MKNIEEDTTRQVTFLRGDTISFNNIDWPVWRYVGFELETLAPVNLRNSTINNVAITSDSSLVIQDTSLYSAELQVINPVSGSLILKELLLFQQLIDKYDLKINDSCGFHVHVDLSEFVNRRDSRTLKRIVANFIRIQKELYSRFPTRQNNKYCMPLQHSLYKLYNQKGFQHFMRWSYRCNSVRSILTDGNNAAAKYFGINLHSLFYRGSLEFRIFPASLDIKQLATYISFCIEFIEESLEQKIYKLDELKNERFLFV